MSALDEIKQYTTIVADTGDFEGKFISLVQIFNNNSQQLLNLSRKMPPQIPVFCWQPLNYRNIRTLLKNRY
jgi:hypothetical protein